MQFAFMLSTLRNRRRCTGPAAVLLAALVLSACAGEQSISAPDLDSSTAPPSIYTNTTNTDPTILFEESFEDAGFGSRGWYDYAATPTITDTTHVAGSTHALEARYPAGGTNPNWVLMRRLFTSSPTVYVSYWVRYTANWVGSGQSYHPHELLVLSDMDGDVAGLANSWMAAYIEHNYTNGGIPRLAIQDSRAINTSYGTPPVDLIGVTENRSVSGCNGVMEVNVVPDCFNMPPWYNAKTISAPQAWFQPSPGPGYKGNWNHVEAYFAINSIVNGIAQADGVAQYWFNGALVIDRHDVTYRTGARPNVKFHQFVIAPYIGDGSPVNQTMWIDNLTVATGRMSSDSGPPPPPPPPLPPPPPPIDPGTVTDLAVVGVSDSAVTLSFTEVSDGTGLPAKYFVRYAPAPIEWSSATDVASGSCSVPMAGTTVGAKRTCDVRGLSASTTYDFQLVAFRGTLNVDAVFGGLSNVANATTLAPTATIPGTVSDLAVVAVTDSSVTLSFTEVGDGTGLPASYFVRFAEAPIDWGSATDVTRGSCKVPMAGTAIGAKRTCRILGLKAATSYDFQLVAFRGTLNVDAVFGELSNVASAVTKLLPLLTGVP